MFLKAFFRDPKMIGAIVQSSSRTVDRVLSHVDWQRTAVFVEYGPGVGTFSEKILENLKTDGLYIAIDPNPDFVKHLKEQYPDSRMSVVQGSAEDVAEILHAHGKTGADFVISGLPFTLLPEGVGDKIARATKSILRPGGAFLVYQYSRASRKFMEPVFTDIEDDFELLNIPPCKIFCCWNDR